MLSLKNQTGHLAEPEVDFVPVVAYLILEEGETAAALNITILEVQLLYTFPVTVLNMKGPYGK